jgi:hypothetical protein
MTSLKKDDSVKVVLSSKRKVIWDADLKTGWLQGGGMLQGDVRDEISRHIKSKHSGLLKESDDEQDNITETA